MNFEFTLHGVDISKSELGVMLEVTGVKPVIKIEAERYLPNKLIDASKLFALSIEKQSPELAALAAKLAIKGKTLKKTKVACLHKKAMRLTDLETTPINVEEAIEKITTSEALRHIGAATILSTLQKSGGEKMTLRQIATRAVNRLAFSGEVGADSACFRGFRSDSEGNYKAVVKGKDVSREDCYHASPMYTALREGSQTLRQWELINAEEIVTFGSEEKDLDTNSQKLRRTVYKISLSPRGIEMVNKWGDLSQYVSYRWSQRVRSKSKMMFA
jgi:hypothetical protein